MRRCRRWHGKAQGYRDLREIIDAKETLKPQDKIYSAMMEKSIVLFHLGDRPLEEGLHILGAHIDSPRLDLKQNPLYESGEIAYLDTHYYGGIKKYQWVTLPLALHGVIVKKDGTKVMVNIGEKEDDPVFCVSDLLVHLAGDQMQKKAASVIEGEDLNVTFGSMPLAKEEKDKVKANVLKLLADRYDIEEADFVSAEIEVVPAGAARDLGIDRSMILGYGQDDRVCAFTSLKAMLSMTHVDKTAVCLLVDKEEVGSQGATGMQSHFFVNALAEVMNALGDLFRAEGAQGAAELPHAQQRCLGCLRSELCRRDGDEQLRVLRQGHRLQQVHRRPRKERLQRRQRGIYRGAARDHGKGRRTLSDQRAGQGRSGRRRNHRLYPGQLWHGGHRLRRGAAQYACALGDQLQGRHL